MGRKTLVLAMLISAFVVFSLNADILGFDSVSYGTPDSASLDMGSFNEGNMLSFAAGNLIIFLVLAGAVYFVMRSIGNSFGRVSG